MAQKKTNPRPNGNGVSVKVDLLGMVKDIAALKVGKVGWLVAATAHIGLAAFLIVYIDFGFGRIEARFQQLEERQEIRFQQQEERQEKRFQQQEERFQQQEERFEEILKRLPPPPDN